MMALKRIEGQIRGVQKMIEKRRHCLDILTQLHSIAGAIGRVEDKIFHKHLETCVGKAFRAKSENARQKNIMEAMSLLGKFRRKAR